MLTGEDGLSYPNKRRARPVGPAPPDASGDGGGEQGGMEALGAVKDGWRRTEQARR